MVTVVVIIRSDLCLTFLQQSVLYKVSAERIRSNRRPELPSAKGWFLLVKYNEDVSES